MELATHARGQIARRNRLQQRRQRLQIAIGGGHQSIKALHHHPEVILEALGIPARGEVAMRRRVSQLLDLPVHRRQVCLHFVHGLAQHRFLAGQAIHVLTQIADRIAPHDLRQLGLDRQMRGHQRIGLGRHPPVIAGKRLRIDTVTDLAGIVALGHFQLRTDQAAQLLLHAIHRDQQPAGFVLGRGPHVVIQLARCNRLGGTGRAIQRHGQTARDQPRQQTADQHHEGTTDDKQITPSVHRLARLSIGITTAFSLQIRIGGNGILPLLHHRNGLGHHQIQRRLRFVVHAQIDDAVIDLD